MKKILITTICIVIVGTLLFLFVPNNKKSFNAALQWSGIQVLPTWATNISTQTKGSMFSREFVITFTGTKEQIEEWKNSEAVLKNAKRLYETRESINDLYILNPQAGAGYAEIRIDTTTNTVTIRTYWS